jgi:hypothetical protein
MRNAKRKAPFRLPLGDQVLKKLKRPAGNRDGGYGILRFLKELGWEQKK